MLCRSFGVHHLKCCATLLVLVLLDAIPPIRVDNIRCCAARTEILESLISVVRRCAFYPEIPKCLFPTPGPRMNVFGAFSPDSRTLRVTSDASMKARNINSYLPTQQQDIHTSRFAVLPNIIMISFRMQTMKLNRRSILRVDQQTLPSPH
jgi:hypothetical protein